LGFFTVDVYLAVALDWLSNSVLANWRRNSY